MRVAWFCVVSSSLVSGFCCFVGLSIVCAWLDCFECSFLVYGRSRLRKEKLIASDALMATHFSKVEYVEVGSVSSPYIEAWLHQFQCLLVEGCIEEWI